MEINRDALLQVAQVASGSLRDAENILERLILTYGEKLELEIVQNALNVGYETESFELIRYILSGDTKKCLEIIHTIGIGGNNLRFVHKTLLEYIRLVLHAKTSANIRSPLSDEKIKTIKAELEHLKQKEKELVTADSTNKYKYIKSMEG